MKESKSNRLDFLFSTIQGKIISSIVVILNSIMLIRITNDKLLNIVIGIVNILIIIMLFTIDRHKKTDSNE
jgi:uncharacterized membrane protein YhaH (DUF805 family)